MQTLVTLPDHPYYLWQALVQAYANPGNIYLVYRPTPGGLNSPHLDALNQVAAVHVWDDWRTRKPYNPAMKPGLVGRWLDEDPRRVDDAHLLIDPDVIITGARTTPTPTPTQWWGTDTDSYTGPGYLAGKGALEPLYRLAARPAYDWTGAGAQLAFTGKPGTWWAEVAETSERIHQWATGPGTKAPHDGDHPVQAWCAEMYATQLLAPRLDPHDDMSMVWANGLASEWDTAAFFHDAGVTTPGTGHFLKTNYQISPWNAPIPDPPPASASARYVDLIRQTAKAWPELIW